MQGIKFTCLDINPRKLQTLRSGKSPFLEPGLSELMTPSIDAGRLVFTDDKSEAYDNPDVIFICVGTPTGKDNRCDISFVTAVAQDISTALTTMSNPPVVVVKSTVPVGTTQQVAQQIQGEFHIANNPEFLREGSAIDDFLRPDRVVLRRRRRCCNKSLNTTLCTICRARTTSSFLRYSIFRDGEICIECDARLQN